MSIAFGFAVFLVIWWLTLFMVLPFGVKRVDPDDLLPGEDPGAPAKPQLMKKFAITTALSVVLFAIFYFIQASGWISFRQ